MSAADKENGGSNDLNIGSRTSIMIVTCYSSYRWC